MKTSVRIIKEVAHDSFGPSDVWDNVPIVIPSSLAPSGPAFCNIIKISYQIEVLLVLYRNIKVINIFVLISKQFIVDPGAKSSKLEIRPMVIVVGDIALLPSAATAPLAVAEVFGNEINGFKAS